MSSGLTTWSLNGLQGPYVSPEILCKMAFIFFFLSGRFIDFTSLIKFPHTKGMKTTAQLSEKTNSCEQRERVLE